MVTEEYRPEIIDPCQDNGWQRIHELRKVADSCIEALPEAVEDLFRIECPYVEPGSPEFSPSFETYKEQLWSGDMERLGAYAWFPWKKCLVHLPASEDFFTLRTARNKFLVTEEEQRAFYNAHIGIAGLSVGSSVLNALVLTGGGGHLRIADFDTLSITNLNRLFSSVCDLTVSKGIAATRRAYEVNPYADITLFDKGLWEEGFVEFFEQPRKMDLYIEEVDNIRLKIRSHMRARELGIPVIMATDNGDNTIIDVERFDLDPTYPLFHGSVDEDRLANAVENPSLETKVRLANDIVGPDVTPRTQLSLQQVGQTIPAWPQHGNAAILSGVAACYVARRILTGEDMPSGRYEVNIDSLLDPHWSEPSNVEERARLKEEFITGFNLVYSQEEE